MRIQLNRERNNIFIIPDSFIRKDYVRIIAVSNETTIIDPTEYRFMGPRSIKILKDIDINTKIYGHIAETRVGNKIIGNK